MTYTAVQRVLGLLLALFSVTMLPPILVSFIYGDGTWQAFGLSFLIILGVGILIWSPVRADRQEMRL